MAKPGVLGIAREAGTFRGGLAIVDNPSTDVLSHDITIPFG
jgi:hypothetical protein